ncbi:MAG TPA: GNAT family N-acetyltransferase [Parvibaculum sp.]
MSRSENPGVRISVGDAHSLAPVAALHAAAFDEPWGQAALAGILAMPGAFMLQATGCGVWFGNDDNISDNNDNIRQPPLLGFVIARIAADEAEILTVAVDISHRGQGLGRKLMEAAAAFALASGAAALFLEVADDNVAALALYERLGFVTVGMRPDYYARGTARIAARTMRLGLTKT